MVSGLLSISFLTDSNFCRSTSRRTAESRLRVQITYSALELVVLYIIILILTYQLVVEEARELVIKVKADAKKMSVEAYNKREAAAKKVSVEGGLMRCQDRYKIKCFILILTFYCVIAVFVWIQ